MLEGLPIMLALCFMLWHAYYAQNYAGIIDAGLPSAFWHTYAGKALMPIYIAMYVITICTPVAIASYWLLNKSTSINILKNDDHN